MVSDVSASSLSVAVAGESPGRLRRWFLAGLRRVMTRRGHRFYEKASPGVRIVLNFIKTRSPRPFRRRAKGTFVISVAEAEQRPDNVLKAGYPLLVQALSNLLVYVVQGKNGPEVHFVTLEQGCYNISFDGNEEAFFEMVYERLAPLAASQLVIDNEFAPDLPEELWEGDETTAQFLTAGQKLDEMGLLPAPFPLDELVSERDLRHIKLLYGIGGLSYGNMSARADTRGTFWMSASGVDKANLREIGRDILLIRGYDLERRLIKVSVPPNVRPRRASVDAIEHCLIYEEHPGVGAIVHIHAWIDGVKSTEINFPCGTYELAQAVSRLIREAPDPTQAIIGLHNHGLTITGSSLDDIFARIGGKVLPQVPMS